jgi:hypothetical protein
MSVLCADIGFEEIYPAPTTPAPTGEYILRPIGDGCYEIVTKEHEDVVIGDISRQAGDEDHYTTWDVKLVGRQETFRTFKDARAWLRNPRVRQWA